VLLQERRVGSHDDELFASSERRERLGGPRFVGTAFAKEIALRARRRLGDAGDDDVDAAETRPREIMRERRRYFLPGGVPSSATHRVRRHVHVRGGVDAREHRGGRGEDELMRGGFGRHEVRAVIAGDARVDGRARGDQGVERRAAVDAGHVHEIGVERGDFLRRRVPGATARARAA
jgi:hypothetical protein